MIHYFVAVVAGAVLKQIHKSINNDKLHKIMNRKHNAKLQIMRQHIAFGVSFLQSQISIDDLVLLVSFAAFRWRETNEIQIGD